MTALRRDRVEIWLDILAAVRAADERQAPSRICSRTNLPHDRFWRHVDELFERGLLEREPLRMTESGQRLLEESVGMRDLLGGRAPRR